MMRQELWCCARGLLVLTTLIYVEGWTTPAASKRPSGSALESAKSTTTTLMPKMIKVSPAKQIPKLSNEVFLKKLNDQLGKMKLRDDTSPLLTKEDLKVVYEDDHLVVIDKPPGVLTVSGRNGSNSLAQAVCAAYADCEMAQLGPDRMVVHRLGMDSSGLIVFAKTKDAVRGMNTVFRTRNIRRRYEALVCGHIEKQKGIIDLPLMYDYDFPPYVRVSTDQHQEALLDLDAEIVGKKILEMPKQSITRYKVLAREEMNGHPVTRIELTSVSGRYHQLNCHLATLGHPIVGDKIYGYEGEAASNGGLDSDELEYLAPNSQRASEEARRDLSNVETMCCHARSLKFIHPVSHKFVELQSKPSF